MKTEAIIGAKGSMKRKIVIGIGITVAVIIAYVAYKKMSVSPSKDEKGSNNDKSTKTDGTNTSSNSSKGGKGKGKSDSGATADGNPPSDGTTAPDGISAPTPSGPTAPGETSVISYISNNCGPGAVPCPSIAIRSQDAVFPAGSLVTINHPNYPGSTDQYPIISVNDDAGGAQDMVIGVPFNDTGVVNSAQGIHWDNTPGGTISLVGLPADNSTPLVAPTSTAGLINTGPSPSPLTSFEGMPDEKSLLEFSGVDAKRSVPVKVVGGNSYRLFTPKEAAQRRKAFKKAKGLKLIGQDLRNFIKRLI